MNSKHNEKPAQSTDVPKEPTQYDFDKSTFIVEPVFKEKSNDTLGTVLLRLINKGS